MSASHALPGLIVSKQGIQAVASDDTVSGLLCLKISLPHDHGEQKQPRYPIFQSDNAPPLLGKPEIHAFPFSEPNSPLLIAASRLLNLGTSYPPVQHSLGRPTLDVSQSTGQIYVCPGAHTRRQGSRKTTSSGSRSDWIILIRFQLPTNKLGHAQQVSLGLPKCLDNVVRFQILSPHASTSTDSGEVHVLTEPKVRPVPSAAFRSPKTARPRPSPIKGQRQGRVAADEGWEDGEDMGPEGAYTDEEETEDEDTDTEGSWLEGRFPSTDTLHLEWSFGSPSRSTSSLNVTPRWNDRSSTIHVQYESLPLSVGTSTIEAVLPEGWGWSSLSIRGQGVLDWTSTDGDWWIDQPSRLGAADQSTRNESGQLEGEDSFSTVIQRLRPNQHDRSPVTPPTKPSDIAYSSVNLLRQRIPAHLGQVEDFSFEMSQSSMETTKAPFTPMSRPATPPPSTARHTSTPQGAQATPDRLSWPVRRPINGPCPAKLFEISVSSESSLIVEGVLAPISRLTHVSPSMPLPMPFIRIDQHQDVAEEHCELVCAAATAADDDGMVDTTRQSIGTFQWTDDDGCLLADEAGSLDSDVDVRISKNVWGVVNAKVEFEWPRRAREIAAAIASDRVRLVKVTQGGSALPRAISIEQGRMTIRLGSASTSRSGRVEMVLESERGVVIPMFEGSGRMEVSFVGDPWNLSKRKCRTNMQRLSNDRFTFDLSSDSSPTFDLDDTDAQLEDRSSLRSRSLLSWSTLINLFLVWILLSLAIQVQRLRSEVAFVAEEAKDLRLYGLAPPSGASTTPTTSTSAVPEMSSSAFDLESSRSDQVTSIRSSAATSDMVASRERISDVKTSLGRVVFGRTAWDRWSSHPTVQTLSKSVGWVWRAVVWLLDPL